jgi:hypothetical protein
VTLANNPPSLDDHPGEDEYVAMTANTPDKIKVTQTAYDLAMKLFAAEANKKPVPVTKDMLASKLSELTDKKKKIALRQGQSPGRYGKPGTVRLIVAKDAIEPIPNRAPRRRTSSANVVREETADTRLFTLSIAALEGFVQEYRQKEAPLRVERTRSVETSIAQLQSHLSTAKGDDFRNTIAMANRELKKLDEIDHEVAAAVLAEMNPGPGSPLYPIWKAMRGGT